MQLDAMWQFMQVDMEADGFEGKMRQSPRRLKLIKHRDFLKDQQATMKKLEAELAVMQDRLAAVQDEADRLGKALNAMVEEFEANEPADAEAADKQAEAVKKLLDSLTRYENELAKMRRDAQDKDRQQKDIRTRAAKAKQEFDLLKGEYEKELAADTETLNKMRARTEQEAKKLPKDMLERYTAIKQHCTPPMAKLVNGQCGGCFMSLAGATLLDIQKGDKIVVCDNCGRILYDPGE